MEAAYATMARAAGLEISETRLLSTQHNQSGYFATKRFDRFPNNRRVHVASSAALLDVAWDVPSLDYDTLLKLTRHLTHDHVAVERMFRRMVFNIITHNRDDHAKQHAFLMDDTGAWTVAPAYDLTYSRGPGGEHYLAVKGHAGDDISPADITSIGLNHGIAAASIRAIIEQVSDTAMNFPVFASDFGVSARTKHAIHVEIKRGVLQMNARKTTHSGIIA